MGPFNNITVPVQYSSAGWHRTAKTVEEPQHEALSISNELLTGERFFGTGPRIADT